MRITYPATDEQLKAGGYTPPKGPARPCTGRRCEALIEWWTTPKGKPIPMSRNTEGNAVQPHFADCVDRRDFKR
jgi:hypothetical protein